MGETPGRAFRVDGPACARIEQVGYRASGAAQELCSRRVTRHVDGERDRVSATPLATAANSSAETVKGVCGAKRSGYGAWGSARRQHVESAPDLCVQRVTRLLRDRD